MFLTKSQNSPNQTSRQAVANRSLDDIISLIDANGAGSSSGIMINHDSAMRQTTVWSCVRIISEIIAQLPIDVQIKQGGQWVTAETHDAKELLAEPNDIQTQHDLLSTLVAWSEMHGNGYLYKAKDTRGKIRQLYTVKGSSVSPSITPTWSMQYSVDRSSEFGGDFTRDEIFHLRNFGSGGFVGLSTIGNHREGIGHALQLEQFAINAYKNGLNTNKWFEPAGKMDDPTKEALKTALREFTGQTNAGKMPVISGGTIHEFQRMTATDAQYADSRRMQKQDIAAIFGVPLFLLNDTEKSTTWGTGLEQLSRAFIRFSLNPRLNRIRQTLVKEIIPISQRQRTRFVFDTDQFTLGEFKERMDGYDKGISAGVLSPNEAREVEGRAPREGGDEYRQPANILNEGQDNGQRPASSETEI